MPSADETTAFLRRLAAALQATRLRITWKADEEIQLLRWSRQDALDQLTMLDPSELLRIEDSTLPDHDIIWVFCPLAWELDQYLWIRLSERDDDTFLISFHITQRDPWT